LQGCRFLHSGGCGILLAGYRYDTHAVIDASSHGSMATYALPRVPRRI
jgi:hypothetical protein